MEEKRWRVSEENETSRTAIVVKGNLNVFKRSESLKGITAVYKVSLLRHGV